MMSLSIDTVTEGQPANIHTYIHTYMDSQLQVYAYVTKKIDGNNYKPHTYKDSLL